MKKTLLIVLLIIVGCYLLDDEAKAVLFLTKNNIPDSKVGQVVFKDTPQGLLVKIDFKNLPSGLHGFHIHENPSCDATTDPQGKVQAALGAGGHYDPDKTGKYLGPNGKGHKGDLPVLNVGADGKKKMSFYVPHLTVKEIRERSIIVHEGGDNYKDQPNLSGGGGARIACGVIK